MGNVLLAKQSTTADSMINVGEGSKRWTSSGVVMETDQKYYLSRHLINGQNSRSGGCEVSDQESRVAQCCAEKSNATLDSHNAFHPSLRGYIK